MLMRILSFLHFFFGMSVPWYYLLLQRFMYLWLYGLSLHHIPFIFRLSALCFVLKHCMAELWVMAFLLFHSNKWNSLTTYFAWNEPKRTNFFSSGRLLLDNYNFASLFSNADFLAVLFALHFHVKPSHAYPQYFSGKISCEAVNILKSTNLLSLNFKSFGINYVLLRLQFRLTA